MTMPISNELVNHSVEPAAFADFYAAGKAPWEIGRPQGTFAAAADRVSGPVLDAGCGTGEHALFFAARGHRVTGIDFVEEPIQRARAKAAARGLAVEFLVKDARTLGDTGARFASVIDSGLFHCFSDADRRRYVEGLARVEGLAGFFRRHRARGGFRSEFRSRATRDPRRRLLCRRNCDYPTDQFAHH